MRRRSAVVAAVLGAALVVAPSAPVRAGGDPPAVGAPPTVGAATVANLVAEFGTDATADDSSATGCMGGIAEPVGYRTDRVAVRSPAGAAAVGARVRAALDSMGDATPISGIDTVTFAEPPGGDPITPVRYVSFRTGGEPVPIVALARKLSLDPFHPMPAAPVYLLGPSDGPLEMWPEGAPDPTTEVPPVRAPGVGAGVTVAVYDTGVPAVPDADRPPNVSRLSGADVETIDAAPADDVADHAWDGHTVAIADVLATLAPGAVVRSGRITEASGVATEESATRRMETSLRNAHAADKWPEVVVISSGSAACDLDPARPWLGEMEPLGLQMVAEAIDRFNRAVFVASAGNRSTDRRYYPAAFSQDSVVAVGALDIGAGGTAWTSPTRSGPRARFSNHGWWVDAYAAGVGLATRHVKGVSFEPRGPVLNGRAEVSGTSYTSPYVAALVAEVVAGTGQDPLTAWRAIRAAGTGCPDSGGGVAVTLTTLQETATTKGTGTPDRC